MRLLLLATALCSVAACGGQNQADIDKTEQSTTFVPPDTREPAPIKGQAHTNPITAYVGKYPGDTVDGVTFFDRTEVANALISAVGDDQLRRMITAREGVKVPIFMTGGRIAAHGCEPQNCEAHNWTFLLAPDATGAEACFHDAAAMGDTSRWYDNDKPVARPGNCPTA